MDIWGVNFNDYVQAMAQRFNKNAFEKWQKLGNVIQDRPKYWREVCGYVHCWTMSHSQAWQLYEKQI